MNQLTKKEDKNMYKTFDKINEIKIKQAKNSGFVVLNTDEFLDTKNEIATVGKKNYNSVLFYLNDLKRLTVHPEYNQTSESITNYMYYYKLYGGGIYNSSKMVFGIPLYENLGIFEEISKWKLIEKCYSEFITQSHSGFYIDISQNFLEAIMKGYIKAYIISEKNTRYEILKEVKLA